MLTDGQAMSWYHSKILRIPHGKQNPTKRYLSDDELFNMLDGNMVIIQEKVDGKLSCYSFTGDDGEKITQIYENMTNKNTCHKHVIEYTELPLNKQVSLDKVVQYCGDNEPFAVVRSDSLNIATLDFRNRELPEQDILYNIFNALAQMPSKFGSDVIEGIVLKTVEDGIIMNCAKWINDEFEDKLLEIENDTKDTR